MIKDAYPFTFLMNSKDEQGIALSLKLFRFKSAKSNIVYIVRVEVYPKSVYAVKFYPKKFSDSPNKYRLLTNTFEPRRIVNTCTNVMLSIYGDDPMATFGFIGANGMNETSTYCTKRYKFYSKIIATYFGKEVFEHKESKDKSAYLLVNRKALLKNPNLLSEIEDFFTRQFDYFD